MRIIRVNNKPSVVIGGVSVLEGHSGAATALFTATLSCASENELSTTTIGNKTVSVDGAALVGGASGYASGRSLSRSWSGGTRRE